MRAPIGLQGLSYEDTHRSSKAIIWGVPKSSEGLSYGGTPKVIKAYPMGVGICPYGVSYSGTHYYVLESSSWIRWPGPGQPCLIHMSWCVTDLILKLSLTEEKLKLYINFQTRCLWHNANCEKKHSITCFNNVIPRKTCYTYFRKENSSTRFLRYPLNQYFLRHSTLVSAWCTSDDLTIVFEGTSKSSWKPMTTNAWYLLNS